VPSPISLNPSFSSSLNALIFIILFLPIISTSLFHLTYLQIFRTVLIIAFVGAFEEISDWNFREQLEVNFFGTANIIRCVLPGMRQRRSGHIINITGLTGQIGTPSLSLLSAAHHAVEGYSEVNPPPQLPIPCLHIPEIMGL